MIQNQDNITLFFILGRPRSGTTMLRSMFDAHPNVIIPPEFPALVSSHQYVNRIWDEKDISAYVRLISKSRKFPNVNINPNEYEQELRNFLSQNGSLNLEQAFRILIRQYKSVFDKAEILALGDKNPLYAMHVQRLRNHFSEAKFIFIRRHIFSVVDSAFKTNFELHWPAYTAYLWRKSIQKSFNEIERNASLCKTIQYEAILENPPERLDELCNFIGIPFSDEMLNFNQRRKLEAVYGSSLDTAHSSLLKDVASVVPKKWIRAEKQRHRIAAAWAGKYIEKAGYSPINVRNKWFYFILGLPSVCFALFIRSLMIFLNRISGGKIQRQWLFYLATFLYGRKSNAKSN